jgi:hypothetical protein
VRVPLPFVCLLAIAVTLGSWWAFTRRIDFLTPPSAESLAVTSQRALASLPRAEVPLPAQPPKPRQVDRSPPRRIQTRPPESSADAATRHPSLDTYVDRAAKGSRHLIELSTLVEASGDRQRALLGWERVLDSTKPQATHLAAAIAAVKRLRPLVPAWSARNAPFPVVIRLNTSKKFEYELKPILNQVAAELEQASAGILKVSTVLTANRKSSTRTAATPFALWLTGPAEDSPSTATFSFTITREANLHPEILRYLFKVVCNRLAENKKFTAITTPPKTEATLDALSYRITRLRWHEFGQSLNPRPAPTPPADPQHHQENP